MVSHWGGRMTLLTCRHGTALEWRSATLRASIWLVCSAASMLLTTAPAVAMELLRRAASPCRRLGFGLARTMLEQGGMEQGLQG